MSSDITALRRALVLTQAKREMFRSPNLKRLKEAVRTAGRTGLDDKEIFRLKQQLKAEIEARKKDIKECRVLNDQLNNISGKVENSIRVALAPVADTIKAQQAEIDDQKGQAIRMAVEMSKRLDLTQQEQRVFDALIETAGNELATAQSLATRYSKGFSRSNVQLIRGRIEKKLAAINYANPRTFWAKEHPLAHTIPARTGKKTGTMPAP